MLPTILYPACSERRGINSLATLRYNVDGFGKSTSEKEYLKGSATVDDESCSVSSRFVCLSSTSTEWLSTDSRLAAWKSIAEQQADCFSMVLTAQGQIPDNCQPVVRQPSWHEHQGTQSRF